MTSSGTAPLYILVGSPTPGERHRHPIVAASTSEAYAREAFRRLRLEVGPGAGWGGVVVLEEDRARPLCWFGPSEDYQGLPSSPMAADPRSERMANRRLRSLSVKVHERVLRAVRIVPFRFAQLVLRTRR